jgi:hypothetical protein
MSKSIKEKGNQSGLDLDSGIYTLEGRSYPPVLVRIWDQSSRLEEVDRLTCTVAKSSRGRGDEAGEFEVFL